MRIAPPYDTKKCEAIASGGRSRSWCATSAPSTDERQSTTWPMSSLPRRPARPAIWSKEEAASGATPKSPRFDIVVIAVQRAGMLIPAASVSVANTALRRPSWKSASTSAFSSGSIPAWCAATPALRSESRSSLIGSKGCAARKASIRAWTDCCWEASRSGSRRPEATDCAAWSQPAREKMKTIAGSIFRRASARMR